MANTLLTPTAVTREALRVLHNNLTFAKRVNRQYDDSFAKEGAKIGTSLKVRLPNKYTVRSGATLSAQDVAETSVTLAVATQIGVDVNFTSAELTMDMDNFSDRILQPAMARLASEIDSQGLALYADIYNQVGTAGVTPATALVALQAGQKLDEFAAPRDNTRTICYNPAGMAATVNGLTGLFQDSSKIAEQYAKGMMGRGLGFDWFMDQNIQNLTTGSRTGTILMNGTTSSGATTISIDGFGGATQTVTAGEVFTIAGVNAVNPETGADTGSLQQFVVTAAATASSSAVAALAISPAIISSGATKTVTAVPADNAAVTFVGGASTTFPVNMAFHRDAFTLATADLILPTGVDFAARETYDGVSMRVVRQYDINTDKFPCRIDLLFGWKTLRASQACRIIG